MQSGPIYLHGGRIHLHPDSSQVVDALLLREGRVQASGTTHELAPLLSPQTAQIDLGGRTVIPGLIDAHIHLEKYARWLKMVDCEQPTATDCLERLSLQAAQTPQGTWILGHGWNQYTWGGYGNIEELDAALPNHPAYLTAKSLHAAWVNSRALQLAGIDGSTPDPEDGVIGRDASGRATGLLFEAATRLVADRIPVLGSEQLADDLAAAQLKLAQAGLTGVHDFDGPACLRALQILRERGELSLRILKNIPVAHLAAAHDLGLRSGFGDAWIRIGNIKLFADGALGPRTAAMLQPYGGEPENRGMLLLDGEALTEVFEQAAQSGFGLTVHAIGDRANHEVLNAYGLLRKFEKEHALPQRRHRIEHLQILHPDDLVRPSELNLVASMQPVHATSDMEMADQYWGDRTAEAYAWRTQLHLGARLAFGSDAPVENPDPLLGIHAAVTRRREDGSPGIDGWVADQRISIAEALAAYTTGPAFAAGTESWQGQLTAGFAADLVVLNRDPFLTVRDQLLALKVQGTMVAGEWSYRGF
ncbi:MAG: amidohydrolase [Anaerolineae bacterium]|nr:MAG: amidohydrolase [Anaerolineae bacterium]